MTEPGIRFTPAEVKAIREALGLSTRWLAEYWHVPEQSVQRWERHRTLPPGLSADLAELQRIFDTQVAALCASGAKTYPVPRTVSPDQWTPMWHRAVALTAARNTGATLTFDEE